VPCGAGRTLTLHVGGFAAEVPSTNGICTARALARFYAALTGEVDGHHISELFYRLRR
jgi:hypothetical protein